MAQDYSITMVLLFQTTMTLSSSYEKNMKAVCISNSGSTLSAVHLNSGYTTESTFSLIVRREYTIYGISLYKSFLNILVCGQGEIPSWYPLDLFAISDPKLPPFWSFKSYINKKNYDLQALWGYEELINDEEHYDRLLEREPSAIATFLIAKEKFEKDYLCMPL